MITNDRIKEGVMKFMADVPQNCIYQWIGLAFLQGGKGGYEEDRHVR